MPCSLLWHHVYTLWQSEPHLLTHGFHFWWYTVPEFLEHKYCLDILDFLCLKYRCVCVCVRVRACACVCARGLSHFSHVWLFSTLWTIACQPPLGPGDSPGRNIGVGCDFLLHRIFLTKRSNSFLPHWQADSLLLSHKGRPVTYLLFIM